MTEKLVCKCGKGYASKGDGFCRFCREKQFSRAQNKRDGIRPGSGRGLDQADVFGKFKWPR